MYVCRAQTTFTFSAISQSCLSLSDLLNDIQCRLTHLRSLFDTVDQQKSLLASDCRRSESSTGLCTGTLKSYVWRPFKRTSGGEGFHPGGRGHNGRYNYRNTFRHQQHQFLTPSIWRRWVRMNYLHCPRSFVKSITPLSISSIDSMSSFILSNRRSLGPLLFLFPSSITLLKCPYSALSSL